jgi:hypothetical protein
VYSRSARRLRVRPRQRSDLIHGSDGAPARITGHSACRRPPAHVLRGYRPVGPCPAGLCSRGCPVPVRHTEHSREQPRRKDGGPMRLSECTPPPPTRVQALCAAGCRRMFIYSSHERCASPRVRPLSRKHRPRTRRRVGRAAAGQPLGVALATRSRLGPVHTCPFPLARARVGMRVWVCVCVQVGVSRMTSTARAAGQRARPNAASTLSTHGGTPVPTVRPHTCGPSAGLLGCARVRVRTCARVCPAACVGVCARACACAC